jgi:hypothetical protein
MWTHANNLTGLLYNIWPGLFFFFFFANNSFIIKKVGSSKAVYHHHHSNKKKKKILRQIRKIIIFFLLQQHENHQNELIVICLAARARENWTKDERMKSNDFLFFFSSFQNGFISFLHFERVKWNLAVNLKFSHFFFSFKKSINFSYRTFFVLFFRVKGNAVLQEKTNEHLCCHRVWWVPISIA